MESKTEIKNGIQNGNQKWNPKRKSKMELIWGPNLESKKGIQKMEIKKPRIQT